MGIITLLKITTPVAHPVRTAGGLYFLNGQHSHRFIRTNLVYDKVFLENCKKSSIFGL